MCVVPGFKAGVFYSLESKVLLKKKCNDRERFIMKKTLLLIAVGAVLAGVFVLKRRAKMNVPATKYIIGILQTASHPALDAVREGFIEEVTSCLSSDVSFVIQNAQGTISQLHAVAQQFQVQRNMDAIFAIATPAAQAVSAIEKEKPVIIAAVTDPQALGLVHERTNVCGVTDMINVGAEVEMLQQLLPSTESVGLLYTSGETNSVIMAKKMRHELQERGMFVTDFAMSNEAEVQAITDAACRKVDVLLAPTDNTIASTITVTSTLAQKYKKPFIVSDNMLVVAGPLAARGVDYRVSGKQAGKIACELLVQGKKPSDIQFKEAATCDTYINRKTADLLGVSMPEKLQDVVFVN